MSLGIFHKTLPEIERLYKELGRKVFQTSKRACSVAQCTLNVAWQCGRARGS